jgi:hypothetical protein
VVDKLPKVLRDFLTTLKDIVAKHSGKKAAERAHKNLLKSMLKARELVVAKTIPIEDVINNTDKYSRLIMTLVQYVTEHAPDMHITPGDTERKQAKSAGQTILKIRDASLLLGQDHVSDVQRNRFISVMNLIADDALLLAFICDARFEGERRNLVDIIEQVMGANTKVGGGIAQYQIPCCISFCARQRVVADLPFKTSSYCVFHHYVHHQDLLNSPSFATWMQAEDLAVLFKPFVEASQGMQNNAAMSAFQRRVEDYRTTQRAESRLQKAQNIFRKFCKPVLDDRKRTVENTPSSSNSGELPVLPLSKAAVREIQAKIDEIAYTRSKKQLSKRLFQTVLATTESQQEDIFNIHFLNSDVYKDWASSVTLPQEKLDILQPWIDKRAQEKAAQQPQGKHAARRSTTSVYAAFRAQLEGKSSS